MIPLPGFPGSQASLSKIKNVSPANPNTLYAKY